MQRHLRLLEQLPLIITNCVVLHLYRVVAVPMKHPTQYGRSGLSCLFVYCLYFCKFHLKIISINAFHFWDEVFDLIEFFLSLGY